MKGNHNNMNELKQNSPFRVPQYRDNPSRKTDQHEVAAIRKSLSNESVRRKNAPIKTLTILVDGNARCHLELSDTKKIELKEKAEARLIEVVTEDNQGSLLLATLLLKSEDLCANNPSTYVKPLEGGQTIKFDIAFSEDSINGDSYSICFNYQESLLANAKVFLWKLINYPIHAIIPQLQLRQWIGIGVIFLVIPVLIFAACLYRRFNEVEAGRVALLALQKNYLEVNIGLKRENTILYDEKNRLVRELVAIQKDMAVMNQKGDEQETELNHKLDITNQLYTALYRKKQTVRMLQQQVVASQIYQETIKQQNNQLSMALVSAQSELSSTKNALEMEHGLRANMLLVKQDNIRLMGELATMKNNLGNAKGEFEKEHAINEHLQSENARLHKLYEQARGRWIINSDNQEMFRIDAISPSQVNSSSNRNMLGTGISSWIDSRRQVRVLPPSYTERKKQWEQQLDKIRRGKINGPAPEPSERFLFNELQAIAVLDNPAKPVVLLTPKSGEIIFATVGQRFYNGSIRSIDADQMEVENITISSDGTEKTSTTIIKFIHLE